MPGIGQKGAGVRQHPQYIAEHGKIGNTGQLVDHALLGIIEPPGSSLLDFTASLRSLERTDNSPDHRVIGRCAGVQYRSRQNASFIQMIQKSNQSLTAISFCDAVKSRVRP